MMREIAFDADVGSDDSETEVSGEGSVETNVRDVTEYYAASHGMERDDCLMKVRRRDKKLYRCDTT